MKPKISTLEEMFTESIVKYIKSEPTINILHTGYNNETDILAKMKICELEENGKEYIFSLVLDFSDLGESHNNQYIVCLFVPQYRRLNYTVDFAFFANEIPDVSLGVEIDGYEWHDKTKEQAARDKRRDRELLLAGLPTIHFAGTEVYSNAMQTVEDTVKIFSSMIFEGVYKDISSFTRYIDSMREISRRMRGGK
jgi:very-short-patch-repair endonuclease